MARPRLADWKLDNNKGYGEAELPRELWNAQVAVSSLNDLFRERLLQRRRRHVVPPTLYHYTNVAGLHGMLSSFMLWLSDAALMNDPLEGTWVHHRAKIIAAEVLGESSFALQVMNEIETQLAAPDLWDKSLRNDDSDPRHWAALFDAARPAFIASFTEEGDLLSQWRGYGARGRGVAIGFDLNKLDPCVIQSPFGEVRPTVIKVEYDTERQDNEVKSILMDAKAVHDIHIDRLSVNHDAALYFTRLFYYPIRDAFYWLRWEFKSPHYSEEKEWRLVANPLGFMRNKSRIVDDLIVPYMEMPLPQIPGKPTGQLAIPEIVLGPRCSPSLLRGIRGLLQNVAFPEIVTSRLSMR